MKFAVVRTSSNDYMEVKDFSTIEDLIAFMEEQKYEIIIQNNSFYGCKENIDLIKKYFEGAPIEEIVTLPYRIEIYDDYRE